MPGQMAGDIVITTRIEYMLPSISSRIEGPVQAIQPRPESQVQEYFVVFILPSGRIRWMAKVAWAYLGLA